MKLSTAERYAFNRLRALSQSFNWDDNLGYDCGSHLDDMGTGEEGDQSDLTLRHYRKKVYAHIESYGFTVLAHGAFSFVMSHPKVPGKVFKWNPTNDDRTFGFVLQLLHIRHARLPEYYAVEGNADGYIAMMEELFDNPGYTVASMKHDDDFKPVIRLIERMGFEVNDLVNYHNIMTREDGDWVLSDPIAYHGDH
jgi:hypothetical protein